MTLLEGGGGSIPEMLAFLPSGGVAYALVRMGFGSGRFRRNHFLFVHWSGDACPAFAKVKANAKKAAVKAAFRASAALEFFASTLDEIELTAVLDKMNKCVP